MKAYQIGAQNGIAALAQAERDDPTPGQGEAILRVRLVSLNSRDVQIMRGTYPAPKSADRIPVSEGVGEIVAVGEGVTNMRPGERVICAHFTDWLDGDFALRHFGRDLGVTDDGWLAEIIRVPMAAIVPVPTGMSDRQAVALSSAGLTAWHAIVEIGKVKAGDLVLVLGTGGVSIFALQIAKAHGARVAVTSSSDEKLEKARALGADILINYRTHPEWAAELMRETGQSGADIIVETGGPHTLAQSIAAAAVHARIIIIGVGAGMPADALPNYGLIIAKNITLKGIANGSRAMLARFVQAVEANGIEPVIDRVFLFDEAQAAYEYLDRAAHVGKVLIQIA